MCELADGTLLSALTGADLLDEAVVERIVFDSPSRVVDLGRARRFVGAARRAVEVRDRHCIDPGCDVPAERCEVDHVWRHADGGPTHPDNGRLRCGPHNRARERAPTRTRRRPDRPRPPRSPEQLERARPAPPALPRPGAPQSSLRLRLTRLTHRRSQEDLGRRLPLVRGRGLERHDRPGHRPRRRPRRQAPRRARHQLALRAAAPLPRRDGARGRARVAGAR